MVDLTGAPEPAQLAPLPNAGQRRWLEPKAALSAHDAGLLTLTLPFAHTLRALASALHGAPATSRPEVLHEIARNLSAIDTEAAAFGPQVPGIRAVALRSPTLPPATHTNCYVLGERRLAVVDPGTPYPEEQADFVGQLQRLEAAGAKVTQSWITHHHLDHVGAALRLKKTFGAPICAHAATAHALADHVQVDVLVHDGQALPVDEDTFTALHTPGHAAGHLCFWRERGGHLFSGDNVLGTGTPLVPPAPHGDMTAYMGSLERILRLNLGLLFPGHGPPCATSAARVAATLDARRQREALLLSVLQAASGPQSLEELVTRVYRGLGAGLRGLAELATLAHLEKLQHEGRVSCQTGEEARWSASE